MFEPRDYESLPEGTSRRGTCPFCDGRNTFSVSKQDGHVVWHCFKASCKRSSGSVKMARSTSTLRDMIRGRQSSTIVQAWTMPSNFVPANYHEPTIRWLNEFNAYTAVVNHLAQICFDPIHNRVVFIVKDGNTAVDAVGRSLYRHAKPKWLRYGKANVPFICGKHKVAVVVEDCTSACTVSPLITGVALLGTNLSDEHVMHLRKFDRIIVALDKDASRKGNKLAKSLSFHVPTTVCLLEQDLKYNTLNEVEKILKL